MDRVESPCIEVCRLDHLTWICMGCFRTAQEIAEWPAASDEQKRKILVNVECRKESV